MWKYVNLLSKISIYWNKNVSINPQRGYSNNNVSSRTSRQKLALKNCAIRTEAEWKCGLQVSRSLLAQWSVEIAFILATLDETGFWNPSFKLVECSKSKKKKNSSRTVQLTQYSMWWSFLNMAASQLILQ